MSSAVSKFDTPNNYFKASNYPNLEESKELLLKRGVAVYLLELIACSHNHIMRDESLSKGMKIASMIALTVASIFIAAPIGIVDALARSILALISSPLLLSDKTSYYPKAIGLSALGSWAFSTVGALVVIPLELFTSKESLSMR
jgi:hypothetical protein